MAETARGQETIQSQPQDRPLLMVHYMPWYQAQPLRRWGWHWTMDHFNPDRIDSNGRREIASHYFPLTGPYDSNDEKILEYQVLLMKLSGIDGLIADWYGSEDFFDYALINESTHNIFRYAEKAGLLFAVCYEDQTIKHMVENGHFDASQDIVHGWLAMGYLEDEWFTRDLYLKAGEQPVLLNFGPQYFRRSADWETLFSILNNPPLFFTLDIRIGPAAAGAFPWPPMSRSVGGVLSSSALGQYLDTFYQNATAWSYRIGGAFPGFNDIYEEAGVGSSYGYLAANNGQTFISTLQKALESKLDVIQIITWNDFGEGTNIEPAVEYGYQYLEIIQNVRRNQMDANFAYSSDDLLLPFQIYELRIQHENDPEKNALLDDAFEYIVSDNLPGAYEVIEKLTSTTSVESDEIIQPVFTLEQNYPNPFNPQTTISYSLEKSSKVTLAIYNISGQIVETLIDTNQRTGNHSIIWDATGQVAGIYFCRISTGGLSEIRKMVLVR